MKLYLLRSIDNSEMYTHGSFVDNHGIFESPEAAKAAISEVWYEIKKFKGEPTKKEENKWVQVWGEKSDWASPLDGYTVKITELESEKIYKDF